MAIRREDSNCFKCEHKKNIPGNAHIYCMNPDPEMTGDEHGRAQGWFNYPGNFDPVWMTKSCDHFKVKTDGVSDTVSDNNSPT